MTPYAHIIDALKTMEERGVEATMADWEAMAEFIEEEETINKEETDNDTRRID